MFLYREGYLRHLLLRVPKAHRQSEININEIQIFVQIADIFKISFTKNDDKINQMKISK